jgi:hypothetical protein
MDLRPIKKHSKSRIGRSEACTTISHLVGLPRRGLAPSPWLSLSQELGALEILVAKAMPFRSSEGQKDQGNASRSSVNLVGFVDIGPLVEAGIDGSRIQCTFRAFSDN